MLSRFAAAVLFLLLDFLVLSSNVMAKFSPVFVAPKVVRRFNDQSEQESDVDDDAVEEDEVPLGDQNSAGVYQQLAVILQDMLSPPLPPSKLTETLTKLASSQQTFKGLDGAAHEAYQRTHSSSSDDVTAGGAVAGRAQRSLARLGGVTEGLLACELSEAVGVGILHDDEDEDAADDEVLQRRQKQVILNISATTVDNGGDETVRVRLAGTPLSILVLYDPDYNGGAGLDHGTLSTSSLSSSTAPTGGAQSRGRLLVVLGDTLSSDMVLTLQILNETPLKIRLASGLVANEVASVQSSLYKTAGELLTLLEPQLRQYNASAVHFVGHSLAGGVASLAATILDGSIPMPKTKSRKRKKKSKPPPTESSGGPSSSEAPMASPSSLFKATSSGGVSKEGDPVIQEEEDPSPDPEPEPLNGLGRGRSSALSLGAPPCLSSNVMAAFCTSFIYGDDVVCRTTRESLDRLVGRVDRNINGGFVGRNLGWMTDTLSLTVSSLQSHAHGSEGEEIRLSIPGRAYLVRPRRLGGIASIHEVGNLKKGGREALREALLWQIHDVLLSKSMWKHHSLESYIHGLDRVQLRGILDDGDDGYTLNLE